MFKFEYKCCEGGGPMSAGCYHDHCKGARVIKIPTFFKEKGDK
jgi:hypothetical protein